MEQRSTQKELKVKRTYRQVSYYGSRGKTLVEKPVNGRFTAAQTERLLTFFEKNRYPKDKHKRELARELALEVNQVTTWFSNRRSRLRRAALKRFRSQTEEKANTTTSEVFEGQSSTHPVTMATSEKHYRSGPAYSLSPPSQSFVPSCKNSGFSLPRDNISIPHGRVVDDVITLQYRRTCFVPTAHALLPREPWNTRSALLAIPLSHQQGFEHSDFNPTQCLQYCDQLLQKMFGRDWIDRVCSRQN